MTSPATLWIKRFSGLFDLVMLGASVAPELLG